LKFRLSDTNNAIHKNSATALNLVLRFFSPLPVYHHTNFELIFYCAVVEMTPASTQNTVEETTDGSGMSEGYVPNLRQLLLERWTSWLNHNESRYVLNNN
jgi:hypothetical protein